MWAIEVALTEPNCTSTNSPTVVVTRKVKAMNWTNEEISSVNSTLIPKGNERQRPVELPPSPHGLTPDGLADYREFPLTRASAVIFSKADFSKCRSPKNQYGVEQSIMLTWVTCDQVIFDRSRPFHSINGQFSNCSFRRIGTNQCGIVGTYTDCDFSGASFRNAHLVANFVRCKFHDCNMKVASWGSSFESCEFSGATIDPLFEDVRNAAFSADAVTFVVLNSKVHVGETRYIS